MTATDLVPMANAAALDSLDPHAREVAITSMLDQARTWLAHAVEFTAPAQDIAEFRAFIATAAETARRLKVSKEIQLDAEVMVRRTERALGQAIRDGQERGEIRGRGQGAATPPGARNRSDQHLASPRDFASMDELIGNGAGIYDLADGVSDEQFEVALEVAREEGNPSRANVVRKVREVTDEPGTYAERQEAKWARIAEMAASGHTRDQIAREVGMTTEGIRNGAQQRGIDIRADRVVGRTRRLDTNRIIRQSVLDLEGIVASLALINRDDIDPEEAQTWVDSLNQSIKALSKARTAIKESIS